MIVQAIGGALQSVSASMSPEATITDPAGGVYKVNDQNVSDKITRATVEDMKTTKYMYETFKSSVNNGILRRNTIFNERSVTGNVYFHIGNINLKKCKRVVLFITTKDGITAVEFTPRIGE